VEEADRRLFLYSLGFSYAMTLGGFDVSAFGDIAVPLVWCLWALNMLFNQIVMLNLLISIIGNTYGRVNDSQ
jgi:hypothetical protein